MHFVFNSDIAKEIGVDEAIMLENIQYWIKKNKANEKNFFDGDYWTYNSTRAFEELFPFWTKRQIERILKSLEFQDCIKTGNYNQIPYDRTKWYALTKKSKSLYAFGEMETQNYVNENNETCEPIPNINTNNKQNNICPFFENLWKEYPKKLGKNRISKKALKEINAIGEEKMMQAVQRYKKSVAGTDPQYIKQGSTFFNGDYVDYLEESKIEVSQKRYAKLGDDLSMNNSKTNSISSSIPKFGHDI